MKKSFLKTLICVITLICVMGFSACDMLAQSLPSTKTLQTPTNVRVEGGALCWNPVEYASGYTVSIDNKEYIVTDYQYPLSTVSDGDHVFKVKANGDGIIYITSAWSEECKETLTAGEKSSTDYYGQFDELTKKESFLGYGFDVINSSVFSDKYVKTSFPIFNTQKLMEQRLLKVDSKQSYVEEIKSSDMEQFMQDWNAKANVDVKWGSKKVGGSVEVETKYSGGVENARSKYFHSISFYNQKFYIVLQSDINTYKQIINDSFKADLYSDMEPAELFERYGTHFITSAVMGGKINSYYLYTSESEKSYHNVSAQVSTEVRAFKTGVEVNVGGGYKNTALNENIYIENTLEVIGGDDFGMISDEDISKNYLEWEKSLDQHASLMGIKDTSSLIPLWQLIDSNLDTNSYTWIDVNGETQTGSRSEQLQSYFQKYGVDAYNSLMRAADLPEIIAPENIDNIKINNTSANDIGEYEVYAGVSNDISFAVSPDNAMGYSKTASLTENTDLAAIDNQNGLSLIISPDCEHGKVFNVVLSAGSVRKTIKVRVIKKYTVVFKSNGGSEIPTLLNVEHDSQIDEPAIPEKEGYVFAGWYTTGDFKEETKFQFGVTPVVSDLMLYVKWDVYYPEINFVHNVQGSTFVKDKVKYNTAYAKPEIPKITGYVLNGFYKDEEMLIPFDFSELIKESTTIYVKWDDYYAPIKYKHNVNGCPLESDSVKYNEYLACPENLYIDGYTLNGFYKDVNHLIPFDFSVAITEPITIYVKWDVYYPEINFVHNVQGSTFVKDKVKYNTAYAKPEIPKITGYVLNGFYKDEEMLIPFDFSELIKESTTIYVKWDAEIYDVIFISDCDIDVPTQQVAYKNKAQAPIEVYKEGYQFMGWYANGAFSGPKFDFSTNVIEGDTILYAQWADDPISIVFEANGGICIDSENILKGQSLGSKLPTPTRDYYEFGGWYLSNEFNDKEKAYSNTVFTENTVLYAKWDLTTYNITYVIDDYILSGDYTTTYQLGSDIVLPLPSKDYYLFTGWCVDDKYENKLDLINLKNNPQNITIYGKLYKNVYVISFADNDVTMDDYAIEYSCGDTIILPTISKDYFTFDGWYEDSSFAKKVDVDKLTSSPRSIKLYAKFLAIDYTLEFIASDGNIQGDSTVTYNILNAADKVKFPTVTHTIYPNYVNFVAWIDQTTSSAVVNDFTTNPRNAILVAGWEDWAVFTSIDATPRTFNREKIIVDWRDETVTNLSNHTAVDHIGRKDHIDIVTGAKKIVFVGDSSKTYVNLRLTVALFENGDMLELAFDNFNVITNYDSFICGSDINMKCKISTYGNSSFKTSFNSGSIISGMKDLTISGSGNLSITAGNGIDGSNGISYHASSNIRGGNGSNGSNGGIAIISEALTIDLSGSLEVFGGNGGNGGNGGDILGESNQDGMHDIADGGNGGHGGHGGKPIETTSLKLISCSNMVIKYGNGGRGGNGGKGGDAYECDAYPDQYGHGGHGGYGGHGHIGGNGGNGGNGGHSYGAYVGAKERHGVSGNGGNAGSGGNSVNSISIVDGMLIKNSGSVGGAGTIGYCGTIDYNGGVLGYYGTNGSPAYSGVIDDTYYNSMISLIQ